MLPMKLVLLLSSLAAPTTMAMTPETIIATRGANPNAITSSINWTAVFGTDAGPCHYDGVASFSHPMSLRSGDKYFATGQLQFKSIEMMVDEINASPRCGILVDGKKYGISLTTFGDDSSTEKVAAIVENGMIPMAENGYTASFWLGPYSSGLTMAMSPFANQTNTVFVAGGAADTHVFSGYPTIFGTLPPTEMYLAQAIEALSKAGAKTVASVWEDANFTREVCTALPSLAERHGLVLQSQVEVPSSPLAEDLDPVASNMSQPEFDPDVVVTCVYDAGCAEWIAALRKMKWSPRGQVFTVCVGMDEFADKVGNDALFMTGISPWDPSLALKDAVVGWNASEFADRFFAYTSRSSTYHSASAAASVGALVQAIERADSFDSDAIAAILANEEFTTLYGKLSFDENGQSKAPSLFLQYDSLKKVQIVHPLDSSSGELVYPMPGWDTRDCIFLSTCQTGSVSTVLGECQADGTCKCKNGVAVSKGVGAAARCYIIPVEDKTYITSGLIIFGLVLCSLLCLLSLLCAIWTIRYRARKIVKASQPEFLCLICSGVFVMALSIIPLGVEADYREIQDIETGGWTEVANPDIPMTDAACMAMPWLFSMGFAIIFSAFFAKIVRINRIMKAAQAFRKKQVAVKDVIQIMVGVIFVQVVILLTWQLVDPMIWQRDVIYKDYNGYPTHSTGRCRADNALAYVIPLVCVDLLMLFYALYLCYVTRKFPSEFQESTWITASVCSIVQILLLSIPILVTVQNNNDALYFVRTAAIFLIGSTVTVFMFVPKMYRLHVEHNSQANRTAGNPNPEDTSRRASFVQSVKSYTEDGKGIGEQEKETPVPIEEA